MEDNARPEDYRLLGVEPQVTLEELDRAYHRAKALYAEGSLATYSLMDEAERSSMRDRIEKANLRISRTLTRRGEASFPAAPPPGEPQAPAEGREGAVAGPAFPPPLDWSQPPGPQFRRLREERGIPLKQVSTATRVRSTHFANIEEGNLKDLPATVYLRGFVIEYARHLGFPDPEGIAAHYLSWVARQEPDGR